MRKPKIEKTKKLELKDIELRQLTEGQAKVRFNDLNYLQYCLEKLQKHHAGDLELLALHILSAHTLSIKDSDQLHLLTLGASGKGKGHVANTALMVFPNEFILDISSCSERYLIYAGKDLNKKIVFIPEIAALTENQIPFIRNFTDSKKSSRPVAHGTVDEKRKAKRLEIEGQQVVWFNCENPPEDTHILNRVLLCNPDESKEADKEVHQLQKINEAAARNNETKKELRELKDLTRVLLENDSEAVIIPYMKEIEFSSIYNRRSFPNFINLLRAVTKVNMFKRMRVTVDNIPHIVSTKEDFDIANWIWKGISEVQQKQVTKSAIKVFDVLDDSKDFALDKTEIASASGLSQDNAYRKAKELVSAGWANSVWLDSRLKFWRARASSVSLGNRANWANFKSTGLNNEIFNARCVRLEKGCTEQAFINNILWEHTCIPRTKRTPPSSPSTPSKPECAYFWCEKQYKQLKLGNRANTEHTEHNITKEMVKNA